MRFVVRLSLLTDGDVMCSHPTNIGLLETGSDLLLCILALRLPKLLALDAARSASTEGTGVGELNVLLAVETHHEGRDIHEFGANAAERPV